MKERVLNEVFELHSIRLHIWIVFQIHSKYLCYSTFSIFISYNWIITSIVLSYLGSCSNFLINDLIMSSSLNSHLNLQSIQIHSPFLSLNCLLWMTQSFSRWVLKFPILPVHLLDDFLSAWDRKEGFRILTAKWFLWSVMGYINLVTWIMISNLQPVLSSLWGIVTVPTAVPTAIVCGLRNVHWNKSIHILHLFFLLQSTYPQPFCVFLLFT